jgi:UDP-2,4-diacetamido-2,4,6-trideoxy-beta-L-altropyranose hydrolase
MKIAIRADASPSLGLGHAKRCLSLAQALRERGAEVRFFSHDRGIDPHGWAVPAGFEVQVMQAEALSDPFADALGFLAAATRFEPDWVVVDHYGLGAEWHDAVHERLGCRLAAIDDLGDRPMHVHLLVDPNLSPNPEEKHRAGLRQGTRLLSGPAHALLAPAYARAPRHVPRDQVQSVGIFMGGTDAADLSSLAWHATRHLARFHGQIEIATTRGNPNLVSLQARVASDSLTCITLDQPDLAGFFARHDLHIGAGGGATWERCCIGAPTLAVLAAGNQYPVLLPLQSLGVMVLVNADPPSAQDLAPPLQRLLAEAPMRRDLSERARRLVDGLGALRVAQTMETS